MSQNSREIEARLRAALASSHAHGAEITSEGFPREEFDTLQDFQLRRLERSYADLSEQASYRMAAEFFLEELYGGLHFLERDRQVEKVLPLMVRLLPAYMLEALADAFHLQALSIELDLRLCRRMRADGLADLDESAYAAVYSSVPRQERREQLRLVRDLGLELCELVRHRAVLLLSRVMRGPAHAAGFGALQDFLERGMSAFRAMGKDGPAFVKTIHERETAVMENLYAGRADPFGFQKEQPK